MECASGDVSTRDGSGADRHGRGGDGALDGMAVEGACSSWTVGCSFRGRPFSDDYRKIAAPSAGPQPW